MTTKFVGLKDFRQRMAWFSDQALRRKQRLIILKKNRPLFELRPIRDEESLEQRLLESLKESRQDVTKGRVYSHKQVHRMLGL